MRNLTKITTAGTLALALTACGAPKLDPRGLARDEVLVQISATGRAESKPTEARFSVGVSTIAASSVEATNRNGTKMTAIVAKLKELGVAEADIQTSALTVSRQDWGPARGKFEANNSVTVRMRDVAKAGAAIGAVTQLGANVLSGPDLRVGDPEAASRSAYAAAYKAARARADTYAEAAGLKVGRILRISDGGQSDAYPMQMEMADRAPQAMAAPAPPVMAGTNESSVSVSVDFALTPK